MDVRVGPYRRVSTEELMLLNCGAREDLRVPWTARRSNQSVLKEINPEYSLEGQMLKLKLQYFGHLMRRTDSLEKPLTLGQIEGSLPKSWLFPSGGQSIGASTSVLLNEYSGLISFRVDWFDLLSVQGTLKSLLQHHNSNPSILRCSAFFMVQLSHLYMTTGKTTVWLNRPLSAK